MSQLPLFMAFTMKRGAISTPIPWGISVRYNVRFRRVKEKVPNQSMDPIIKMFHNSDEKNHKVDDLALRSLP